MGDCAIDRVLCQEIIRYGLAGWVKWEIFGSGSQFLLDKVIRLY